MSDPERIVVAGDWHGNEQWAVGVIEQLPRLLPGEGRRIVLHVGDFGVWPGLAGSLYLRAVKLALAAVNAELWFVDGNHEDHDQLDALARDCTREDGRVHVVNGVHHLPRGHRWEWHGRTWLALGGATSVDSPARRQGFDWWPQEAIGQGDYFRATEPGTADVMVTHDCPAGVPLDLPKPPSWWAMEDAYRHRLLLGAVVSTVQPSWLVHGHYHLEHDTTIDTSFGPLRVTGLDRDGALRGNFRVLDVRSMEWVTEQEAAA